MPQSKVTRVTIKLRGINEVMTSPGVTREVAQRAARMARSAGEGFGYVVKPHRYTARAFVQTIDQTGRVRLAREHVLQRVLGGG
jgi:hypothetical protein